MHALVLDGAILKTHDFGETEVPELAPNKGAWLEIVEASQPAYDPDSEDLTPGLMMIVGVPTRTWTKVDKAVPESIDRWDGLTVLLGAGVTEEAILAAIGGITDPTVRAQARIDFSRPRWRRDFPLIGMLAVAIGLSEAQIDTLYRQAAAL